MLKAPLIKLFEISEAQPLSKFGKVGYKTPFRDNILFVKIAGYVIDITYNEERGYVYLLVDDGTGFIQVRYYGSQRDKLEKILSIEIGDFVLILGQLRHWRGAIYLRPISFHKLSFMEEMYYRWKAIKEYSHLLEKA